jgi:hypothetical protein
VVALQVGGHLRRHDGAELLLLNLVAHLSKREHRQPPVALVAREAAEAGGEPVGEPAHRDLDRARLGASRLWNILGIGLGAGEQLSTANQGQTDVYPHSGAVPLHTAGERRLGSRLGGKLGVVRSLGPQHRLELPLPHDRSEGLGIDHLHPRRLCKARPQEVRNGSPKPGSPCSFGERQHRHLPDGSLLRARHQAGRERVGRLRGRGGQVLSPGRRGDQGHDGDSQYQ